MSATVPTKRGGKTTTLVNENVQMNKCMRVYFKSVLSFGVYAFHSCGRRSVNSRSVWFLQCVVVLDTEIRLTAIKPTSCFISITVRFQMAILHKLSQRVDDFAPECSRYNVTIQAEAKVSLLSKNIIVELFHWATLAVTEYECVIYTIKCYQKKF